LVRVRCAESPSYGMSIPTLLRLPWTHEKSSLRLTDLEIVMNYTNPENLRTPIKSIRAKCLDCTGDQPKEVRLCPVHACPIHPYRMGRRPNKDDWENPPPRYEAPKHLPVWDSEEGRIVSPEERREQPLPTKIR
jgi:hypothetical protein